MGEIKEAHEKGYKLVLPDGKEMKPNGDTPHHGHDCEIGDKDLLGWEVQ